MSISPAPSCSRVTTVRSHSAKSKSKNSSDLCRHRAAQFDRIRTFAFSAPGSAVQEGNGSHAQLPIGCAGVSCHCELTTSAHGAQERALRGDALKRFTMIQYVTKF